MSCYFIHKNSCRNRCVEAVNLAKHRQANRYIAFFLYQSAYTASFVADNKTRTAKVTLKNNQGTTGLTKASDVLDLGCTFKKLSAAKKRDLGISNGVEVVGLRAGKFKEAGIKEGFVIVDINNAPVNSQEEIENIYNAIMKSTDSDKVMFITGIYPTGAKRYYAVDLAD